MPYLAANGFEQASAFVKDENTENYLENASRKLGDNPPGNLSLKKNCHIHARVRAVCPGCSESSPTFLNSAVKRSCSHS